jgi:hypothetical protein
MGVHRAIAEKPPIPRPLPPDFGGKGGLFLMSSASLARRGRRSFCRWQSLPIEGDGGGLCHLAGPIVLLVPLCKRLRAARTLDRRSSPWAASLPRFRSAFGASPPFPPKSGGRGRGLGGLRANEPPWLGKARSAHRSPTGIGSYLSSFVSSSAARTSFPCRGESTVLFCRRSLDKSDTSARKSGLTQPSTGRPPRSSGLPRPSSSEGARDPPLPQP